MKLESFLQKYKVSLIKELAGFIKKPLPDEVRCVEVMLFREALPGLPFRVFFLNRFKGTVKTIESFEPLADLEILVDPDEYTAREEAIQECLELESETDQYTCMDTVTEKYNEENKVLCQWFSECWHSAGGESYPYHAFVVEEDGQFNPLSLKTGKHIKHFSEYGKVFDG